MFRKEYPPLLTGKAEDQLAATRAYLVRLVGYIDEAIASVGSAGSSEMEQAALADWSLRSPSATSRQLSPRRGRSPP